MSRETQGCQELWGPRYGLGKGVGEEKSIGAGRGAGTRAVRQGWETVEEDGRWLRAMPTTIAPRWTAAARVRRNGRGGWVLAALRSDSQDRVPGCTVMGGETRSPEKYYGLYWEIWRGWGGRSEGFRAAPLRRCREQHPRPLPPAPARVCSVRAPARRPAGRKGRGKEPLPGSDATGPRPPAPLPTQSSPPISSPPPVFTQTAAPVP
ncbi:hypothetical protein H8959_017639 [Pygathrix nigripes]